MTVMVPDLVLICENMLMAEGFIEAKVSMWSRIPCVQLSSFFFLERHFLVVLRFVTPSIYL